MKIQNNIKILISSKKQISSADTPQSQTFQESRGLPYNKIPSIAFSGFSDFFKRKNHKQLETLVPEFQPLQEIPDFGNNYKFFNEQPPVKVSENVYRGGRPKTEEGIIALKNLGIKTIISFDDKTRNYEISTSEEERNIAKKYGIKFVHIPWGERSHPNDGMVNKFLNVCKHAEKNPVYFHCNAGQDRAGTMGALYDIENGMKFDQAYSRMISQGHDFNAFHHLDAYIYNRCISKGEKPEDMHPKIILDNLFYSNRWVRHVTYESAKEAIIDKVVGTMENSAL